MLSKANSFTHKEERQGFIVVLFVFIVIFPGQAIKRLGDKSCFF